MTSLIMSPATDAGEIQVAFLPPGQGTAKVLLSFVDPVLMDAVIVDGDLFYDTSACPKDLRLAILLREPQEGAELTDAETLRAIPKKNEVFYSFQKDSNPHERADLPNRGGEMSVERYAREMASYKYVYCPMGAGMDTYRFYEAVCCGCIPIVKAPKGFIDTYSGFNYACVPGTCYVVPGIIGHVWRKESPYVGENTVENTIDLVTFEADEIHHDEQELKQINHQWMHYNNNVLVQGFGGLRLVQPL